MNPTMKERFYGKGNRKQIIYISRVGGLKPAEKKMFWFWHLGIADEIVEDLLDLNPDTRANMEKRVSEKITASMLHCVDSAMVHDSYFLDDSLFDDENCFPIRVK